LKARAGKEKEETGWFMAELSLKIAGKYQLELEIPGSKDRIYHTILVIQPNPELDNSQPDHARLYRLASANESVLKRSINDTIKKALKRLTRPAEGEKRAVVDGKRLFFDLESAKLIPDCLVAEKEVIVEKK
jgi:hypothetical protein